MMITRLLFIFSLLFMSTSLSQAAHSQPGLGTIRDNNAAVKELETEKAFAAEKLFLKALANDPFRHELRFNLGNAYLVQKKYDRALKDYESVVRQNPIGQSAEQDSLRFKALFNGAIAAQELKNNDKALEMYQKALEIDPNSIEVKTNIELLSQNGGGGGGQGDQQKPQDPNDKGEGQGEQPKEEPQEKGVSNRDVKDILEELERQEQKIRALEYGNQKGREKGPDKDW
jgi:Ca-activated chloride channel family protein